VGSIRRVKRTVLLISGLVFCIASYANNADENKGLNGQINAAFHYLVQGDTSRASKLLAEQERLKDDNHQLSKLAIM
jgi:Tfp pilus assembly protein PilF